MWRSSLVVLAMSLVACGSRVDLPSEESDGGTDSGGSSSDTGGSSTDASPADTGGCAPSDCGPAPGAPAERCWDGSTAGPGRCVRLPTGACGWEWVRCPAPKPCVQASDCGAANLFCNVAIGACGKSGTCALKPEGCPLLYAPVCGCNGKTYGNECDAQTSGATIDHKGECRTATTGCGPSGAACGKGDYCKYPDGLCTGSGAVGVCTKYPGGCPDLYAPVCGCDGRTYGNACDAGNAGQSVAYKGECDDA